MLQVDETDISNGNLPSCPSTLDDNFPGIRWLVGILEEGSRDFIYAIVPDKSQENFTSLFRKHIERDTLIITNGHASYPDAMRNNVCKPQIKNHTGGFKNIYGFHPNNIIIPWSLLKYERTKRRSVLKSSLELFLKEFKYIYQYLRSNTMKENRNSFSNIVKYLFSPSQD